MELPCYIHVCMRSLNWICLAIDICIYKSLPCHGCIYIQIWICIAIICMSLQNWICLAIHARACTSRFPVVYLYALTNLDFLWYTRSYKTGFFNVKLLLTNLDFPGLIADFSMMSLMYSRSISFSSSTVSVISAVSSITLSKLFSSISIYNAYLMLISDRLNMYVAIQLLL